MAAACELKVIMPKIAQSRSYQVLMSLFLSDSTFISYYTESKLSAKTTCMLARQAKQPLPTVLSMGCVVASVRKKHMQEYIKECS